MKYFKKSVLVILGLLITIAFVYAEGDVERGKKLFNDPAFAGSTNDRSCNICHKNGKGLENAGNKKYTSFMRFKVKTLEDVVNLCIEKPLKGKPLDKDSQDMKDIVAYIKSLGEK